MTAAGIQIASACDLCFCTKDTQFMIPGFNIGINASRPAAEFVKSLNFNPCKVGMEMLLSGKPISAQKAFQVLFISFVFLIFK